MYHVGKLIGVAVFGILSLVLFAWISISDETNPVFGTKPTGSEVCIEKPKLTTCSDIILFYFCVVDSLGYSCSSSHYPELHCRFSKTLYFHSLSFYFHSNWSCNLVYAWRNYCRLIWASWKDSN